MAKYNGHPGWTAWNVSLWVNNDEGLYRFALDCIRNSRTRKDAAFLMLRALQDMGKYETPDGAPYSQTNLIHAMRGMER